jgi:hypothetical protein
MAPNGGSNPTDGAPGAINWSERRRVAPSTIELWKSNAEALQACGVPSCQMRYALIDGKQSFVFTFNQAVPKGRIGLTFPATYPDNYVSEGWTKLIMTLDAMVEKEMLVHIRGRYERDGVPLDVDVEFLRTIRGGRGVGKDVVACVDARSQQTEQTTLEELIEAKNVDGIRKYCRKDDNLRDMSVEGFVAILTRYLKDLAIRRRAR